MSRQAYRVLGTRWIDVVEPLPGQCRPWFLGRARLEPGYHVRAGTRFPGTWYLIVVLRGAGCLSVGRRATATQAPCAVLLDGGDARQDWRYTGDGGGEPETVAVFLDGPWAVSAAAELQRRSGGVLPLKPGAPLLHRLAELTRDQRQVPVEMTGAEAIACCAEILGALVAEPEIRQRDAANLLRRELECDGSGVTTVAAIAGRLGLSREHLTRAFTRVHGVSPAAWRDRGRLRRACRLLVAGAMPLKTVAGSCGYAGVSTFARAFRRSVGVSPARYRAAPFPW